MSGADGRAFRNENDPTIDQYDIMAQQSLKVRVYGNDLNLRTDNPERTVRIAGYVDQQMTLFHAKIPDQSMGTLAILTALNVAEQAIDGEDAVHAARRRIDTLVLAIAAQVGG
jgi:cell division protein ZapA (FtsZ GTPase activity inhibitor)